MMGDALIAPQCEDNAIVHNGTSRPQGPPNFSSLSHHLPSPAPSSLAASVFDNDPQPSLHPPQLPHPQSPRQKSPAPPSNSRPRVSTLQFASLIIFLFLSIFSRSAAASRVDAHGDLHHRGSPHLGPLLVDRTVPSSTLLVLRDTKDTDEPTTTQPPSSTVTPSDSPEPTSTGPAPELTALPMPFDSSLGNNFTAQSCPDFFINFLNDQTFKDCTPLSLLLYTSDSFFEVSKSNVLVTQTLDAACNVDYEKCAAKMNSLAGELPQDTACGADLRLGNPSVLQAQNGLLAYPSLYQAGCMKDEDGDYCFANAWTNQTSPEDSYTYLLPLGTNLPGRPTCSQCLQDTMAVFDTIAANKTQPLSETYVEAAEQINVGCGPNFVNATIAQLSGANRSIGGGLSPMLALTVALFATFL